MQVFNSSRWLIVKRGLASPLWGGTKIQSAAQQAAEFFGGGLNLNFVTPTQKILLSCFAFFTINKIVAQFFVPPHKGEAILPGIIEFESILNLKVAYDAA